MQVYAPPDWHYPRPNFTKSVFGSMIGSGADAFRIFGPRRIGKTEFLLYDLGLKAVENGHLAVYVSLWQYLTDPVGTIASQCERALEVKPRDRALKWLNESSYHLEVAWGSAKAAIDSKASGAENPDAWARLQAVLDRMRNPQRPSFLFLDEFQWIADHPEAKEIIQRLSMELTPRANGLKVIFTGSSIKGLRKVFGTGKPNTAKSDGGPFFGYSQPLSLSPLDEGFVPHVLMVAEKDKHAHPIDAAEAREVFETCHRLPHPFRNWVMARGRDPKATLFDALFDQSDRDSFESQFARLHPRARTMARLISEGVAQPRGKPGAAWWTDFTKENAPTAAARGTDIATLESSDIVYKLDGRGGYGMTDPLFGKWITLQPKSAFAIGPKP